MTNQSTTVRSLRTVKKLISSLLLPALVLLGNNKVYAQDGKALFQANCAQCHNPIRDVTGPALQGVTTRVPDSTLLHKWIHNNQAVLASGNKYFNALFVKYNRTSMNLFPTLSDNDIDAILKYVETYKAPTTGPENPNQNGTNESDNTLLYGILTLILAIIMFVLLQVNSSLKKLSDDKEGIPAHEPVPFYRNKVYIAAVTTWSRARSAWVVSKVISRCSPFSIPTRYTRASTRSAVCTVTATRWSASMQPCRH